MIFIKQLLFLSLLFSFTYAADSKNVVTSAETSKQSSEPIFSKDKLENIYAGSDDTIFIDFNKEYISALKADVNYYFEVLTMLADTLLEVIPDNKKSTVSITPFKSSNLENSEGRALAEGVIFSTRKAKHLDYFKYKDFKKAVRTVSLRDSKLEYIPLKIATELNSDYSVSGYIIDIFGEKVITGILRETKSGKVLNVVKVVVVREELDRVTNFVLQERNAISSYVLRSTLLPGWGQVYGNRTTRGIIFMTAALASYSATAYSWYKVSGSHGDEQDENMKYAEIASITSLGILGLNIIDASIIGFKDSKKYDLYFVKNREELQFQFAYRW